MNIEEAKKLIDKQSIGKGGVGDIPVVKTHIVKVLLDQLDKPKLEVPQMIADVIESFDEDVNYLHEHMSYQSDEVREWLTHNEREFYEAWLAYPNITVEKENLYTVEIPNPNERQLSFVLMRQLSGNVSIKVMHRDNLDLLKIDNNLQLTESEIRKDFDWAWQFRKDVTE
ncbi:TPA: DUF1642 domain-containing protein [Streptococcus agalactiae]|uniref:DUF1642 domain-containing protein n=1 Tax=Streptococcus agalactiae TaxID=1311 RepID=UPI0002B91A79|nr:DUF1642 domain-containing protein [Streptococcus agalactiae]EPV46677.1 hypothetical protein SAG0354_02765 [Streptococcus agalactiae GB00904]EPV62011.1 hypothetical protein SAG0360_08210 [Streptococcus agalactiae GB00923]EPV68809.1 hypothetical protein SAG0362_09360 [Streptococcus agalactiae GB00929]EPW69970.1 hypothetical protein SAG0096_06610 [Streptococcus agalactiae BSU447]KAF0058451.1 DUF1642 domain-containing protein [Streptococcus agalactiae]